MVSISKAYTGSFNDTFETAAISPFFTTTFLPIRISCGNNISSGAFQHYFGSRDALLGALIEQIRQGSLQPLLPILHDPHLTAIQKLQGIFDTLDRLRMAHRADVIMVAKVRYTDDNALVRLKVDEAVFEPRAPLLAVIIRQGIREGVFTAAYPDQAGEVLLSLLQGMGNTHARLLLALVQESSGGTADSQVRDIEKIVATHAVYIEAIERVLGAPPDCLRSHRCRSGESVGGGVER